MASVYRVKEKNSYRLRFRLVDEDGAAISSSIISTLICTLYYDNTEVGESDRYHLATINSRYNQDVLNDNNVTVSASGTVTWIIQPEDLEKLNSSEEEDHVALFTWYWDVAPNTKRNNYEFRFKVRKVNHSV